MVKKNKYCRIPRGNIYICGGKKTKQVEYEEEVVEEEATVRCKQVLLLGRLVLLQQWQFSQKWMLFCR